MAILIVDDEAETRARLDRALRESGDDWDVAQAASAAEALKIVPPTTSSACCSTIG